MQIIGKKKRNEILKFIGIVAMAADHIGLIFFPHILIFRIIGRIAFPIFASAIAEGYRYTSNFKNYAQRLFIFAVAAQIPFALTINPLKLNIIFTLGFALLFIHFFNKKNYLLFFLILILSAIVPMEYGLYGVVMAFLFYKLKGKNVLLLIGQTAITIIYFYFTGFFLQLFSFLGVFMILYFPKEKFKIYLNKYFFYWFYPAHLLLLLMIKIFVLLIA